MRESTKTYYRVGIEIKGNKFIQHFPLADDKMFFTQDGEHAGYVYETKYTESKWGLQIHFLRTVYINKDPDKRYVDGIKVKILKILHTIIDQDVSKEMEIMKTLSIRRKAIAMLNDIFWSRNINKRKRMTYHSIMENMLIYGAEIWAIQKKKILGEDMRGGQG